MVTRCVVIRKYIDWYDFNILCHKTMYLIWPRHAHSSCHHLTIISPGSFLFHHVSQFVMMSHTLFMMNHHYSSWIIMVYHESLIVFIMNHDDSSWIIIIHEDSLLFSMHHNYLWGFLDLSMYIYIYISSCCCVFRHRAVIFCSGLCTWYESFRWTKDQVLGERARFGHEAAPMSVYD